MFHYGTFETGHYSTDIIDTDVNFIILYIMAHVPLFRGDPIVSVLLANRHRKFDEVGLKNDHYTQF